MGIPESSLELICQYNLSIPYEVWVTHDFPSVTSSRISIPYMLLGHLATLPRKTDNFREKCCFLLCISKDSVFNVINVFQ